MKLEKDTSIDIKVREWVGRNKEWEIVLFFFRVCLVLRKFARKKSWRKKNMKEKKVGRKWVFFSCLDWGKNTRIWMKNLNVDELLESCWYHLSNARLEEVGNFPQTFLTILWGKFYHLFLTIFPPNFPLYCFPLWFSLNQIQEKKITFLKKFLFTKIFEVQTEP